jgi:predicted dinucleotide-binding enzyme
VPEVLGDIMPLSFKVVLDCTNPLGLGFALDVGPKEQSGGERVADLAAPARVVKIFNTTGFQNMADPVCQGAPTAMFYCKRRRGGEGHCPHLGRTAGIRGDRRGTLVGAWELEHPAVNQLRRERPRPEHRVAAGAEVNSTGL